MMITLVREKQDTVIKGCLQQWWHVGPLKLTVEITNNPEFNNFITGNCLIAYNGYVDRRGEYDSLNEDYPKFQRASKAANIPFHIDRTTWEHQHHFYIEPHRLMDFMQALEAQVTAETSAVQS
jgi:hypothetical protein